MMICDYGHVAQRAEQLEREGAAEMRKLAEAQAIAGQEHVDGTDGSEIIVADDGAAVATDGGEDESETDHAELREGETRDDNSHASSIADAQLDEADKAADQPVLDVGDQAIPEGREATVSVVRVTDKTAGEYVIEEIDETVAEYNDCDPSEDVYEVVFPKRTTKDIDDLQRYPYPRSMLEIEHRVHDHDGAGDEEGDEWVEDDNGNEVPRQSEPANFGGGESTGVQDL